MSDLIESSLHTLHQQNQPDAQFSDQLEQKLRDAFPQQTFATEKSTIRHSPSYWRRIAIVAALLTLVIGLFATVEPLQTLAQEIINYFVPGEFTDSTELPNEDRPEIVAVETLNEAEEIAGFEALEWHKEGFNTIFIHAAEGYISLVYERENDRGPLVIVSKMSQMYSEQPSPVSTESEIINTTVNDYPAQFVAGWWHTPRGESTQWYTEYQRLIKWQDESFHYSLVVSSYIADTLEDVRTLAESLR